VLEVLRPVEARPEWRSIEAHRTSGGWCEIRLSGMAADLGRSLDGEIGLQATLEQVDERVWSLSISTRRFAQFVCIDVPGYRPDDSWFHLAPEANRSDALHRDGSDTMTPRGQVRALNSVAAARVSP